MAVDQFLSHNRETGQKEQRTATQEGGSGLGGRIVALGDDGYLSDALFELIDGDVQGSGLRTTVVTALQQRALATTAPTDGQALVWSHANNRWEPGAVASGNATELQGRSVANTAPSDGYGLVWSHANNRWEPGAVGGEAGNATQIQGRAISSTAPATGDALIWDGTAWAPAVSSGSGGSGGSGETSPGSDLILFERYW
jgi:hypothetical protein